MRRLPPQEGFAPLRNPPLAHIVLRTVTDQPEARTDYGERTEDGRHVGLDFYDLLIEPILVNASAKTGQSARLLLDRAAMGEEWTAP